MANNVFDTIKASGDQGAEIPTVAKNSFGIEASYLEDAKIASEPTIDAPQRLEQEIDLSKYGLHNMEEYNLMVDVKDQGGSSDDFRFILDEVRGKKAEVVSAVEEEVAKEDLSGFDLGVKGGEVLTDIGSTLKVESKFDVERSPEDSIGDTFKNNLKELVNAGRFAVNIPGDAIEFAGEIAGLVSDPVGTLGSIKDVAVGVADKLGVVEGTEEQAAIVDGIGQALEQNFGTGERAIETLTQNPVDSLFAVFGGASAAKAGLSKTKFAKTAQGAKVLKKLDTIRDVTNPLNAVKGELALAKQAVTKGVPAAVQAPFKATGAALRKATPEAISKKLAGVDDIESAALGKINKSQFDDLINVAEEATKRLDAPTPFELAGEKAIGALDDIKLQKTLAGSNKSRALAKVADNVVDTKPLIDKFDDLLADRFNVQVLDDGTLAGVKGKIPKNVNELQKFADQLAELRTAPNSKINLGNLDALVDNLQDSINFSKLQRPGATATKTEKTIAGFTEEINKALKNAAGNEFVQANDDFRKAANLATDLEKALGGAGGDRAGSLFKSAFSPQRGKTRRIFSEVRDLTGIDLFDEAALAKFSMEAMGDTRGLSLLETAVGGATTGIVNPVSIQGALQTVFQPAKVGRALTISEQTSLLDKLNRGVKLVPEEISKLREALDFKTAGAAKSAEAIKLADKIKASPKQNIGYHGTNAQFDQFLDKMIGKGATAKFGDGVYLSSSKDVAKTYADLTSGLKGGKARLLEVAIPDSINVKSYDGPLKGLKKASDEARKAGFKGIKYNTADDFIKLPGRKIDTAGHSNYIIFNPSDAKIIKSNVINELGPVKGLGLMRDLLAGSVVGLSTIEASMLVKDFFDKSKSPEEAIDIKEDLTPRG